MGIYRHDAIVVHYWERGTLARLREEAKEMGLEVTEIHTNSFGTSSFMVCPDGSKEGWPDSDRHDAIRREFKDSMETSNINYEWCHVRFGGDEHNVIGQELQCEIVEWSKE